MFWNRFVYLLILFCGLSTCELFSLCVPPNCASDCCETNSFSYNVTVDSLFTLGVTVEQLPNGNLNISVTNESGIPVGLSITTEFGTPDLLSCQESKVTFFTPGQFEQFTFTCPQCPTLFTQGNIIIHFEGLTISTQPFTICCPCTRSQGFWACHLDCWPFDPNMQFCDFITFLITNFGQSFQACPSCMPPVNLTLADIMGNATDELWFCLAKQWIAAAINIIRVYDSFSSTDFTNCLGAAVCSTTNNAFTEAELLLSQNVCTQTIPSSQTMLAICVKKQLERFNLAVTQNATCPNYCDSCDAGEKCPTCNECEIIRQNDVCSCASFACAPRDFTYGELGCSCAEQECCLDIQCEACARECHLCGCYQSLSSSSSSSTSSSSTSSMWRWRRHGNK